jgi:hypothetical protein
LSGQKAPETWLPVNKPGKRKSTLFSRPTGTADQPVIPSLAFHRAMIISVCFLLHEV